jgi:CrcB protein
MKFILIGIGGALGALSRSYLSDLVEKINILPLPAGILFVNFAGCFALGIMINTLDPKYNDIYHPLIFIGFLGAFTTFSAFSKESLDLFSQGHTSLSLIYILFTVVVCLTATWMGMYLTGK